MAKRPYTGFDEIASGKRAGMEALIDLLEAHFGLWNNGSFGVRKKRGKSSYSVHATGRGADLSWRGKPYRGTGNYEDACKMMDFLVENADALHIEAVFDYYPKPWGRGYKCDRDAWQVYDKKAFSGAPNGDWVHVEISNEKADDAQFYIDAFKELLGDAPVEVKASASAPAPKAPRGKKPWLTKGSKGDEVKEMQEIVGATADGDFGSKTEEAVRAWQSTHDLHVDGIWGPGSAGHAAEGCDHDGGSAPAPKAPAKKPAAKVVVPDDGGDDGSEAKLLPYPGSPVKRLSSGPVVEQIQNRVGVATDGKFGPRTLEAVRRFQRQNRAQCGPADGVVGPRTWKAMFG
jgi:peptidoglycan hydrolase-like protein with peptidoglycan-binding domain